VTELPSEKKKKEVKVIKLVSGESLLTEVVNSDSQYISIVNPLRIEIEFNQVGIPVIISSVWIPLFKKVTLVHVKQEHVTAIMEAAEELTSYYASCMSSIKKKRKAKEQSERPVPPVANTIPEGTVLH
jgi:hypothetical protein